MAPSRNKTILVFAGAGASKAVQPSTYPTTLEFFERLPETITRDSLFSEIHSFLQQLLGKDATIDIEILLWRLEELYAFCAQANNRSTLPGWMLNGNRMAKVTGQTNYNLGHLHDLANAAGTRASQLIAKIHELVYELYGQLPSSESLNQTWTPLLEPLIKSGATIELVTTNYDMVLEVVLDSLNTETRFVDTGWRGTVLRNLDIGLWTKRRDVSEMAGLLTKLHGSVNWTRDGDKIFVGDPTFKGSHKRHVIVYPGFKGRPTDPVFQAFHNHFADAASRAVGLVFIGFAFRDDHINDICDRSVSTASRVVVIDPAATIRHPFRQIDVTHLNSGFNRNSAEEAAKVLLDTLR